MICTGPVTSNGPFSRVLMTTSAMTTSLSQNGTNLPHTISTAREKGNQHRVLSLPHKRESRVGFAALMVSAAKFANMDENPNLAVAVCLFSISHEPLP